MNRFAGRRALTRQHSRLPVKVDEKILESKQITLISLQSLLPIRDVITKIDPSAAEWSSRTHRSWQQCRLRIRRKPNQRHSWFQSQ
jgi:hypothetical protein